MDALLSAVAGDLIGRCVSFLVGRYQKQAAVSDLARLHRLLLRARTVVDEAEGRQVTNRGMLAQLERLREDMYRGYHVLDTAINSRAAVDKKRLVAVSRPSSSFPSPSTFDTSEGAVILSRDGSMRKLESILESLEATLGDMKEFVVFLIAPRKHPRNILAASLRADLSARSWRRIARVLGDATELQLRLHGWEHRPEYCLRRPVEDAPPCLFYDRRKSTASLTRAELPKVRMQDLLTGCVDVPGEEKRFDVLVWQSRIPPFCSYVMTCDMERAQQVVDLVVVLSRTRLKRRRGQQQGH